MYSDMTKCCGNMTSGLTSKQNRWHCRLEQLMAVLETATTVNDNYVSSEANHGDILQD